MKRLPRPTAAFFTAPLLILAGCAGPGIRQGSAVTKSLHAGPTLQVISQSDGLAPAAPAKSADAVRARYTKSIHRIPMRDGVRLFTIVYSPRDASRMYPILINRTPYSIAPYGQDEFPEFLGPSSLFTAEDYIFVYQDVRGRYMSEGQFEDVRPHLERKSKPTDIDESSDTYNTIEYLLKNVPRHSGRVGLWGISYPGFYVSAGMIDAHPAIRAASPQAPVGDWFFDDVHHHGAFFVTDAFNFFSSFGRARPAPTTQHTPYVELGTPDGYQFFLDLGSLKNVDDRYFHRGMKFWTQMTEHPNYDAFWQARNILPHLQKVAPAVLVVGGWFDAEDLYGTLNTYQAIEKQNPGIVNTLVMGPWRHDGWAKDAGDRLGNIEFGSKTGEYYRSRIELPFFNHYLKDGPGPRLAEAVLFEVGANKWRTFDRWPPAGLRERSLYLHASGKLAWEGPPDGASASRDSSEALYDSFISDPARPVPFMQMITHVTPPQYMTDDQRFAARRPDVLTYRTDPLKKGVTLAGPILADLWVSTSAGDADWVVKLIDVYPPDAKDYSQMAPAERLGGYQMLVRSEVIRGRFRNSNSTPEPFKPDEPTEIKLPLQDVFYTFLPRHRMMVQVQSTWFPLVDRNPQKYVKNIFQAEEGDFIKATHRVYCAGEKASRLQVGIME